MTYAIFIHFSLEESPPVPIVVTRCIWRWRRRRRNLPCCWEHIDEQFLALPAVTATRFPTDVPLPSRARKGDHIVAGGQRLALRRHTARLERRPIYSEHIVIAHCIPEHCTVKKTRELLIDLIILPTVQHITIPSESPTRNTLPSAQAV